MNRSDFSYVSFRTGASALFVVAACAVVQPTQAAFCVVPDSGGTAGLPPAGCVYTTPDAPNPNNDLFISNGFPVGTSIQIDASLSSYFNVVTAAGGNLGGEKENYQALLTLPMTGNGTLAGFNRNIVMQVTNESHSAPRTPNTTPQSFARDMFSMQGDVFGDPDFDVLRITAGTNFGLPSPGHTTLTRLGPIGSDWNVDSFFDITYQIEFQGAPGSVLDGLAGTTTGTARFVVGMPVPEPSSNLLLLGGLASVGVLRGWSFPERSRTSKPQRHCRR